MNNYEQVEALAPGTVFQFRNGAPWLRTETGVRDLIPGLTDTEPIIPESWAGNSFHVTVLYNPEWRLSE